MLIQNCFDLAQFDPVAPHFHLMVCPSLKLDASVRKKPSHVPRLVEFRVWFIRERISDEFLRRKFRAVQVSTCNSITTDLDLTRHSNRSWVPMLIPDVDTRIAERSSNYNWLVF